MLFSIVIVISEFLDRHSKARRTRVPDYIRALRRTRGMVQRVVHNKLRSDFQRVGGNKLAIKMGVVYIGR